MQVENHKYEYKYQQIKRDLTFQLVWISFFGVGSSVVLGSLDVFLFPLILNCLILELSLPVMYDCTEEMIMMN